MTLRETPKLYKRSHKLDLIALGANMGQAYNKIILQQTLNDDIPIDSGEIEVNCEPVNHIELIILHIVVKYAL